MPDKQSPIPPPLPPLNRKSLRSGLIVQGSVSENERPETSVMESINFHFDAIGSATMRKGSTRLGNQLATSDILGLHYLVDTVSAGANTRLIAVNGTVAYYLNANSWTSIRTALTAGQKARFTTYLNYAFMVNGAQPTAVWDGSASGSFVTTGNASGAPTGTVIENFRSRVWIAGNATYPDRLYYSSVPSATTTPVVSWNTSATGGQWIDISPSDGDTITALQRSRNTLLVFKTNRLYRVFDIGQTDPDPYYAVGTSSQESVIETKVGVFFHHATGFYQYNTYGVVQEISRPVWEFIKQIPSSYYASVAGYLEVDGDHIVWCVGTVTANGTTYTNLHLRYSISTQVWTHYTYATPTKTAIRRQPFYTDGTTQYAVAGDNTGNIILKNFGNDDMGSSFPYSLIHRWDNVDGLLSTRKSAMTGNFSHYGGTGTNVAFQTEVNDPDALNDWSNEIGQFGLANTGFNTMNVKARKLRFRIFGQSAGQPFIYNGYELLDVTDEFIQFMNP